MIKTTSMKTSTAIDPYVLRKIDDCRRHGIKLSLARGRLRLHSPERRTILHSDRLEDVLDIDTFVAEGFRKFVLIALLPDIDVPAKGDYCEARWEKDGQEFLGHGECLIGSGHFRYSVSLRSTSLNWTENWNWSVWPNAGNIRSRYDELIKNYHATMRLIAYALEQKLKYHFDPKTHAIHLGDVKVVASNGSRELGFDVCTSQQLRDCIPDMEALSDFLEADSKHFLADKSEPTPMIADIELA
jgi:hypothetical protein